MKLKEFCPRDLIALIVIIGAFFLKWHGADGEVSLILVSVVAFYFGAAVFNIKRPDASS